MQALTNRDKRTIRIAAVIISIYLILLLRGERLEAPRDKIAPSTNNSSRRLKV